MTAAPPPLDREPRSVRPPFAEHDCRFDHLQASDPPAWRRAVHLDRVGALLEPLADLELSDRELAIIEWTAGWDIPAVAPLVWLLHRAIVEQFLLPQRPPGGTEAPSTTSGNE